MSIEAVMSRINQLQGMLAASSPVPTAPPTKTSFSSALASATKPASGANTNFATLASSTATAPASATSTSSSLPAGTPYAAEITAAAQANGVDPALLAGLVKQESGFNPNAGSGAGARGLTQLMPGTAAGLGVTNLLDPVQSLNGGAKYLKQQLDAFGGDVTKALAAYNAGPGAVKRYGGVPPFAETQNYVRQVQAYAEGYRTAAPAAAPAAAASSPTSSVPYSTT
jgi:soluble lytic murein transglycosylase-like protein